MKKVFGLTLMVAVVISLIGCGQNKAATTTEATTTEVVTEATTKESTTAEVQTTEVTLTETVTTEASANDVVKASEELKDNVIITEGLDFMTLRNEWKSGTAENKVFCTYLSEDLLDVIVPFEVIIADEGSDTVEVNIVASLPEETELSFYLDGNVTSIEGAFHNDLKTCSVFFTNNPIEFSIGYDNGKVVKFVVNVTES